MSVKASSYPDTFRFVRHLSRANIDNYVSTGRVVFASTVGPLEGIYVLAGMIFAERVYKEESFGVRFGVLAPSGERGVRDLEAIAEIVQRWQATHHLHRGGVVPQGAEASAAGAGRGQCRAGAGRA